MVRDSDNLAGGFGTENTGGALSGFLAEEDDFDRRTLLRLGSWAAASIGAVIVAILANQSSIGMRREQIESADLTRQSQQIQSVAKESQNEARRLASAIETLNRDRDRLYSRVAVLEQGLDSVTGAIARQNPTVSPSPASPPQAAAPAATPGPAPAASPSPAAGPAAAAPAAPAPAAAASTETPAAAQKLSPAPLLSPMVATAAAAPEKPATVAAGAEPSPAASSSTAPAPTNARPVTPPTSLMASKSMMAPPDPAAGKLIEPNLPPKTVIAVPIPEVVASTSPAEEPTEIDSASLAPKLAVQRTEFGVDVGGANSLAGLRALWRGLLKSRSNAALTSLRPIIQIKEGSNGLGLQLRLVAGPISDAAAAAKICALMIENDRSCTTAVFEGQRLTLNAEERVTPEVKPASSTKPFVPKRSTLKRVPKEEPAQTSEPSTLSSVFGGRER
ncbi:MAG: hypothetical protein ACXWKP_00040 [Bradyrhizobium sp.]